MEPSSSVERDSTGLGAQSPQPRAASADLMVTKISGSEKAVVAKAGHWSNIDNPNEFNAAVGAFLARVAR